MKHREMIITALRPLLENMDCVIAAWEGGSKATGFVDEYSDIDLYIIVEDESVESVFESLDALLQDKFGILRKFRLPEPNWHGGSQTFYHLDIEPRYFYLDIAVFKKSNPNKFMERDRHGVADVWFDKQNIYDDTPTPKDIIKKQNKAFYQSIVNSDFITILEVEKAIHRQNYLDAYPFYYSLLARNVIGLLNLKYRPEKFDFGMRYISRTYNKDDLKLIRDALGVTNITQLADNFEKLKLRYQALRIELQDILID